MRKLVYYIGVSLDGYIAGPAGEFDFYPLGADMAAWLNAEYPEFLPTHLREPSGIPLDEPNRRCDTVVMGRRTYEPALSYGIASPYAHLRQYIVSGTLGTVDAPGVEVVGADPVELVRRLKKEPDGLDIWLCGGGTLAGQLLGEIDELIVKSYPVVAGSGIPAFTGGFDPTPFTPVRRRDFDNGTQISWFARG